MLKRKPGGQGVDGLQFFVRAVCAFLSAFGALFTWQSARLVGFVVFAVLALILIASLVYDALRFFLGERASHWPAIWGPRDRYELEGRIFVVLPVVLTIACALATLYVWVDDPGPTDAGRHSLSGWLVDTFGPVSARPAGLAIFAATTLLLVALLVFEVRRLRNFWGVPKARKEGSATRRPS